MNLKIICKFTIDNEVECDLLGSELVLDAAAPLAAPLGLGDVAQEDGAGGHDDATGREHLPPAVEPPATDGQTDFVKAISASSILHRGIPFKDLSY